MKHDWRTYLSGYHSWYLLINMHEALNHQHWRSWPYTAVLWAKVKVVCCYIMPVFPKSTSVNFSLRQLANDHWRKCVLHCNPFLKIIGGHKSFWATDTPVLGGSYTAEVEFEFSTWAWVQATARMAFCGGCFYLYLFTFYLYLRE